VPVPKVIDFGIAKATQQELTDNFDAGSTYRRRLPDAAGVKWNLFAMLLGFSSFMARGAVVTYPSAEGELLSADYEMRVENKRKTSAFMAKVKAS
jgi:hypothetical protein